MAQPGKTTVHVTIIIPGSIGSFPTVPFWDLHGRRLSESHPHSLVFCTITPPPLKAPYQRSHSLPDVGQGVKRPKKGALS